MDTPARPGDILLGKYRVERVLGQGGMGIVVAARHVELGQLYAIKFLLPDVLDHDDAIERFLREARAAAQLRSEHVARVHDVGRMENGAPYMVMEHLDGCDLKVRLARQGPLPIEDAVTYVLHVCDAISEAHARGIIHRDLKPANLFLVHRHNGSACVKVLDFGISKFTGPEEVDLTNTSMALGSPLYMSPEQMLTSKTVDRRTDIWALGVILYELLTGSSPFHAGSKHEVFAKILQEKPRPLREVRPEVPEGIVDVVTRCLSKRRDDRFATVEELTQALQEFVSLAPRLPMSSVANLEGANTPTSAAKNQASTDAPGATHAPASTSLGPGLSQGTTITFSQTGKPKVTNRRRSGQVVAFVAAGLVLVGGGWMGLLQLAAPEATPEAAVGAPNDVIVLASSSQVVFAPNPPAPTNTHEVRVDEPTRREDSSLATPMANVTTDEPASAPEKPKVTSLKVVKPAAMATTAVTKPAEPPSPTPTTTTKKRRTAD